MENGAACAYLVRCIEGAARNIPAMSPRKRVFLFGATLCLFLTLVNPARARIQSEMFCWVSDVEVPVACDEDGEEPER
jgi:hypothetical protein